MYTITFYSFKGGVGRTMALVNTAAELARRGRKVLLVDFDLEAPGLSTYELLRPKDKKPHRGIVEYVSEFRRTRHSPLVTDFLYPVQPVGKKGGQLWVMPAGLGDADYRYSLNNLNWRTFYQAEDGFELFEDTRLQWEAELHPDYVLIDSRTGHTDIEGICTRHLADAVVLVFYPNEQNLAGLREVCDHIRAAEIGPNKNKEIKLHFVASNVPDMDDEDRYLRRHLSDFRKELEVPHAPIPIIHRNETLQMLDQPVFVLQRRRSRLAAEYRFLVRALQMENPEDREGALLFLREIQKERSRLIDWSEYDWQRTPRISRGQSQEENASLKPQRRRVSHSIGARVNRITEQFWDDAEILFRVGKYLLRYNEPDMALKRFNRALVLQPDHAEALYERAFCHKQLRENTLAAEDLLRYLRDYGSQLPDDDFDDYREVDVFEDSCPAESEIMRKIRTGKEKNETALLELLSISLDEFLKTLQLPPLLLPRAWTTDTTTELLIQQRRWEDAIRWLEHPTVKSEINEG